MTASGSAILRVRDGVDQRPRSRKAVFVVGALFPLGIVSACAGRTTSTTCGEGTVYVNEECLAVAADVGTPIDANGEEVLDAAGSEDSNRPDAAPVGSEACPDTALLVNCAADCGGTTVNCTQAKCRAGLSPDDSIPMVEVSAFPAVLRTPDRPGTDPNCSNSCQVATAKYALAFRLHIAPLAPGAKVTVSPPWEIGIFGNSAPYCIGMDPHAQCRIVVEKTRSLLVFTKDENAPSRNIRIERLIEGDVCP
jgi:hypothetical protein